jgi:two-component system, sensor histidine kinase and response regulator
MGISLLARTPLAAQEISNNFIHLSIKEGLTQGSALSLIQDRKGFIWIGTEDGLNRYDGLKMKIYRLADDDPNSLSNDTVTVLFEDSQGTIWVGTNRGLNRYNRDLDNFTRFLNAPQDPLSLSHNAISAIHEGRASGNLWIGTEGSGLNALDRKTGKFKRFVRESREGPNAASRSAIYSIYEDKAGLLWLATNGGLHAFDFKADKITRYGYDPRDPGSLSNNQVRVLYEDRGGTLWAGTEGGGLNALDRKTGKFTHYHNEYTNPRSLSSNDVYVIYQDRSDRLLIGTHAGLSIFDPKKRNFSVIRNDPAKPESLIYDNICSILEDKTGVLWIGTRGRGISQYVPDKMRFKLYQSYPNDPNSLISNYLRAIGEDSQGNLWIGTEDKGLCYLDRKSDLYTRFQFTPGNPTGLNNNFVYAVRVDRSDVVWIGTLGGGLNKYDPIKKTFTHYLNNANDPGSLSHNFVRCLLIDRFGTLWVGTDGGGLNKFMAGKNSFIRYQNDPAVPGSLGHNRARILFEDRSGILWVGTFGGGLNRLDRQTDHFTVFRHDQANPNSLCNDFVMSLNEDAAGNIWIGTEGGLSRLDPKTGTFTTFSTKDGFPSNSFYGILIDESDNLWLSGVRGISRFNPASRSVKTYDVSDGLQGNEFNGGAYFKTRGGEMFFGGSQGLNSFFPGMIKDNPYPPGVVITDFQISNKTVLPGQKINGRVVLERSITEASDLVLSWEDRFISFEFAALHFAAPKKNRYAYIMEGLEKEWNGPSDRNFVNFTNLPPGHYTFRVKASNNDGLWNETGVSLKIRVVPPFWTTWLFRGLVAVLLLALIVALFRARTRSIRQRAVILERNVAARTTELQQEITVRKKTEGELEKRQNYLQTILFNSPNAIVTTDVHSRITEWSPGAEGIFGWRRDEVLGKDVDDIVVSPEFKEEARKFSRINLDGMVMIPGEAVRYRKDGTPRHVIFASSPILISRKIAGAMAVYTDITELKKAEKEAKEANRAKSEFLANMSHEIRTPMNGIFGMTELALETNLTHEQREYLEAVKTSAESLMNIINDILDFSKIEAKKVDLEIIPFNLRDTVHAIVSGAAIQAEKKGLELIYDIPADIPDQLMGDPGRLRQILTNMLSNAVKFTEKGEVVVSLGIEERLADRVRLHFQVRDTGIGIPPEKLKIVFDPFTQADSSTTRVYGGTGLGLAISTQLVELMKGRIWAESKAGQGSTFHFTAMLGLQVKEEERQVPVRFEELKDISVLVVDDNATNRKILQEMLAHWGMKSTPAESARQALERLDQARKEDKLFKLILIDANMPHMDGFELAEEINKNPEYRNILIMMLSSAGFRGDSTRCRQLGFSAYLTKPVKQSFLLDAIMLALGTPPEKRGETPLITRHSLIQPRNRFSILLAEDNPINQKLAVRILENRGHKVTVVDNGKKTLAALDKNAYDLVLMDVQMPEMDGYQATAEIRLRERKSGNHTPIIAMTAHAMKGDREKCLEAGMDEYVSKPLKPYDLQSTIEQVMDRLAKERRDSTQDIT